MEYCIKVSDSKKYIILKMFVDVTTKLSVRTAIDVDQFAKAYNIDLLLCDVRNVRNIDTVKPTFEYSSNYLMPPGKNLFRKVANLINPHDTSHSYVTAFMQSKGHDIKEFIDEAAAIKWLEKE